MARKSKYTPDQRAALRKARQKKQEKYWEDRAQSRVLATDRQVDAIRMDSDRAYRDARDAVRREIDKFYRDFATAAGISEDEARRKLSRGELQDFKRELERKRRIIREMLAKDPNNDELRAYDTEFEKLSKVRELTRKEALETNIKAEIVKLGGTQEQQMNARSNHVVNTALWMNSADLAMLGDVKENLGVGHPKQVERAARENWQYGDFSSRIWDDKEKLIREAREIIENGFAHNKGAYDMAGDLMTRMNVSHSNALRLVRTEFNHLSNQAALAEYQAKGIKKYKFVSAIDSRTCDVCADLNGQVFNVADAKTGWNFPPMHPNCRSVTVPVIDWDDEDAWDYSDIELDDDELKKLGLTDDEVSAIDADTPRDSDAPAPSLSVQQANQATEDTQSVQRRAELAEAVKQQGEAIEIKARHINDDVGNILDEIGSQEKLNAKLYADAPITLPQAAIEAEHLDNVRTKILKAELDAEKLQLRAAKLDESIPKPDPKRATALEDEIEQRTDARKRRQDADLPNDEVVKQATPKPFDLPKPDATDAIEPRTAFGKWWQKVRDAVERAKERFNGWVRGFHERLPARIVHSMASSRIVGFDDINLVQLSPQEWEEERRKIKDAMAVDDDFGKFLKHTVEAGHEPTFALAKTAFETEKRYSAMIGKKLDVQYRFIDENSFSQNANQIMRALSTDSDYKDEDYANTDGLFYQTDAKTGKGIILIKRNAQPFAVEHELCHAVHSRQNPVSFYQNVDRKIRQSDPLNIDAGRDWDELKKRNNDYYVHHNRLSQFDLENAKAIFGCNEEEALKLSPENKQILVAFSDIVASISRKSDVALMHDLEDFGRMNVEVVPYIRYVLEHGGTEAVERLNQCFPNLVIRCQRLFEGRYRSTR